MHPQTESISGASNAISRSQTSISSCNHETHDKEAYIVIVPNGLKMGRRRKQFVIYRLSLLKL